jgi:hypothetical protein
MQHQVSSYFWKNRRAFSAIIAEAGRISAMQTAAEQLPLELYLFFGYFSFCRLCQRSGTRIPFIH